MFITTRTQSESGHLGLTGLVLLPHIDAYIDRQPLINMIEHKKLIKINLARSLISHYDRNQMNCSINKSCSADFCNNNSSIYFIGYIIGDIINIGRMSDFLH